MNLRERAPLWPISASRILIGILWLYSLRWKLPPDFVPAEGPGLMDWLQLEVQHPAFRILWGFCFCRCDPKFHFICLDNLSMELLVGLSLLTGTLTRLGGFVGLLLALNLGIGLLEVPGEWPWSYVMLAMWQGTFIVTAAGRTLGVDGWLIKRFPNSSLLHWLA